MRRAGISDKDGVLRFTWISETGSKGQSFVKFDIKSYLEHKQPARRRLLAETNTLKQETQSSGSLLKFVIIGAAIVVVGVVVWKMNTGNKTPEEEPVREKARPKRKKAQEQSKVQEKSKRAKKIERRAKTSLIKTEQKDDDIEEEQPTIEEHKEKKDEIEEYVDPLKKRPKRKRKTKRRETLTDEVKEDIKEEPVVEKAVKKAEVKTEIMPEVKKEKRDKDEMDQAKEATKKAEQAKAEAEKAEEEERKMKEELEKVKVKEAEALKKKEDEEKRLNEIKEQEKKVERELKEAESKGKKKKNKGKKAAELEENIINVVNKDVPVKSEEPLVEYRLPPKRSGKAKQVEEEVVEHANQDEAPLVVEDATAGLIWEGDDLAVSGLKHDLTTKPLYETADRQEEPLQELPKIEQGKKPKPKVPVEKDKVPERKAEIVKEEKPQEMPNIVVGEKLKPLDKFEVEEKPEVRSKVVAKKVDEEKPQNPPEVTTNDKLLPKSGITPEEKPKVNREVKKIAIDTAVLEKSKNEEEDKDMTSSPGGSVRSPVGDLAFSPALSSDGADFGGSSEIMSSSGGSDIFAVTLETALLPSIKRVTPAADNPILKDFKLINPDTNKATWTKTHFIFTIDCSEKMAGARWDSVTLGYDACVQKLKTFKDVMVSAFTFDNKVNPFCREKIPVKAAVNTKDIPFTGKGCNFRRAMDYVIKLIERSSHKDYLICLLFLACGKTGAAGAPKEQVTKLISMTKNGTKFAIYTLACETEDESEIKDLANALGGEHYSLVKAEASRIAFYNVLGL
jgi:hypothetical protein